MNASTASRYHRQDSGGISYIPSPSSVSVVRPPQLSSQQQHHQRQQLSLIALATSDQTYNQQVGIEIFKF